MESKFRVNDLVWAKMRGYPAWPARITKHPKGQSGPSNRLYVFFYGTHQHAWMSPRDLCPYSESKSSNTKPCLMKGFSEAIWQIEEDPDLTISSKVKSPRQKVIKKEPIQTTQKTAPPSPSTHTTTPSKPPTRTRKRKANTAITHSSKKTVKTSSDNSSTVPDIKTIYEIKQEKVDSELWPNPGNASQEEPMPNQRELSQDGTELASQEEPLPGLTQKHGASKPIEVANEHVPELSSLEVAESKSLQTLHKYETRQRNAPRRGFVEELKQNYSARKEKPPLSSPTRGVPPSVSSLLTIKPSGPTSPAKHESIKSPSPKKGKSPRITSPKKVKSPTPMSPLLKRPGSASKGKPLPITSPAKKKTSNKGAVQTARVTRRSIRFHSSQEQDQPDKPVISDAPETSQLDKSKSLTEVTVEVGDPTTVEEGANLDPTTVSSHTTNDQVQSRDSPDVKVQSASGGDSKLQCTHSRSKKRVQSANTRSSSRLKIRGVVTSVSETSESLKLESGDGEGGQMTTVSHIKSEPSYAAIQIDPPTDTTTAVLSLSEIDASKIVDDNQPSTASSPPRVRSAKPVELVKLDHQKTSPKDSLSRLSKLESINSVARPVPEVTTTRRSTRARARLEASHKVRDVISMAGTVSEATKNELGVSQKKTESEATKNELEVGGVSQKKTESEATKNELEVGCVSQKKTESEATKNELEVGGVSQKKTESEAAKNELEVGGVSQKKTESEATKNELEFGGVSQKKTELEAAKNELEVGSVSQKKTESEATKNNLETGDIPITESVATNEVTGIVLKATNDETKVSGEMESTKDETDLEAPKIDTEATETANTSLDNTVQPMDTVGGTSALQSTDQLSDYRMNWEPSHTAQSEPDHQNEPTDNLSKDLIVRESPKSLRPKRRIKNAHVREGSPLKKFKVSEPGVKGYPGRVRRHSGRVIGGEDDGSGKGSSVQNAFGKPPTQVVISTKTAYTSGKGSSEENNEGAVMVTNDEESNSKEAVVDKADATPVPASSPSKDAEPSKEITSMIDSIQTVLASSEKEPTSKENKEMPTSVEEQKEGTGRDKEIENDGCVRVATLPELPRFLHPQPGMSVVQILQTYNYNLKASLTIEAPNTQHALVTLKDLQDLYCTAADVGKVPDIIATIRKLKHYKACPKVVKRAEEVYLRLKNLFMYPYKVQRPKQRRVNSASRLPKKPPIMADYIKMQKGGKPGLAPSRLKRPVSKPAPPKGVTDVIKNKPTSQQIKKANTPIVPDKPVSKPEEPVSEPDKTVSNVEEPVDSGIKNQALDEAKKDPPSVLRNTRSSNRTTNSKINYKQMCDSEGTASEEESGKDDQTVPSSQTN